MLYRRLTDEELEPLEKKFIQFLVANTITADDWANMKERRPEQAAQMVDIFSDVVFEETLRKVQFLKQTTPKELRIFRCGADKIELLGLVVEKNSAIDFSKDDTWLKNDIFTEGGISFFNVEKSYSEKRESQIFKMIENGCRITDAFLFQMLEALKKE